MIYLASPYSHPDADVRDFRYKAALETTLEFIKRGIVCFSPIVYGRAMELEIGTDYLSWKTFNDDMVNNSTQIWVLRIPGWQESKGVTYEIGLARQLDKPVMHMAYYGAPEVTWCKNEVPNHARR